MYTAKYFLSPILEDRFSNTYNNTARRVLSSSLIGRSKQTAEEFHSCAQWGFILQIETVWSSAVCFDHRLFCKTKTVNSANCLQIKTLLDLQNKHPPWSAKQRPSLICKTKTEGLCCRSKTAEEFHTCAQGGLCCRSKQTAEKFHTCAQGGFVLQIENSRGVSHMCTRRFVLQIENRQ